MMDTVILATVIFALCVLTAYLVIRLSRVQRMVADCDVLKQKLDESEVARRRAEEELSRFESDSRSRSSLNDVLEPFRDSLDRFNRTFTDSRVQDAAVYQSLKDQLSQLMKLNSSIGDEARALTEALKGNAKVQGDWGEMILEKLLETAGLIRGVNFEVQVSRDADGKVLTDEEGKICRPDVVVMLPGGRCLIVDSKVSLTDYVRMCESQTEEERAAYLKRHIQSVRRHIDELAAKGYEKIVKGAAEHVLMFMPIEGAFLSAISGDRDLCEYSFRKRVVIVSPAHLLSTLHLVSQLWRSEKQDKNAAEIARQAGLLYDRFVQFTEEFRKIEKALQAGLKEYDDCARRLSEGNLSLVARAEKLRELGAKTQKKLSD